MPLPEFVAQHDDRLRLLTIDRVGRNQSPPQRRRNAHESESIGAQVDALHIFWKIVPGDGEAPVIFHECVFDHRRLPNLLPLRARKPEASRLLRICRSSRMWIIRSDAA